MSNKCKYEPIKIGDMFTTNTCGECVVIGVEGTGTSDSQITVQFSKTAHVGTYRASELRGGKARDPYFPSVFNVGYLGQGEYKGNVVADAYNAWYAMMQRCYGTTRNKQYYDDCAVSDTWHNFQNFASWYYTNYKEGYQLDKDTIDAAAREYGPHTCMYLPASVNTAEAYMRKSAEEHSELIPLYSKFREEVIKLFNN